MTKSNTHNLFLELYHQLMNNDLISEKIQSMISYREGRLYELQMAMEDKVEIMKESNVVSIIQFMQKQLKKEEIKWIVQFDLNKFV